MVLKCGMNTGNHVLLDPLALCISAVGSNDLAIGEGSRSCLDELKYGNCVVIRGTVNHILLP